MQFTEREMTVAVDEVARSMYAATRPPWKRGETGDAWEALPRVERYNRRAAVGETLIPSLLALPERPTVGERPTFSGEEYDAAAEAGSRALLEQRSPGTWDTMSDRKRRRVVKASAALLRAAVQAMPVRQDPDAPVVPDHL